MTKTSDASEPFMTLADGLVSPKPPSCKHLIPTGKCLGRCVSTCKVEGWHLTPEAGGACPGCGGYGDCTEPCDGLPRRPWALARRALNTLRTSPFWDEEGSLREVALDLMRITGDMWTVHVPGEDGGAWVEYEDWVAKRARFSASVRMRERVDSMLQPLGLRSGKSWRRIGDSITQADVVPLQ